MINNNDTNNYEPNFTMRDPDPEPEKLETSATETVSTDTVKTTESPSAEYTRVTEEQPYGQFRDPREKFKSESATWGNGEYHKQNDDENRFQNNFNSESRFSNSGSSSSSFSTSEGLRSRSKAKAVTVSRKGLGMLLAACMLVSCLFGAGGAWVTNTLMTDHTTSSVESTSSDSSSGDGYSLASATGSSMTVQEITSNCKNSVVEIKTESVSSDSWMQQYVTEGAGSGVVISADGYIMTNNHVIDGASKITVTTANEKSYEAKLIGTDSTNDVAVIKINAKNLTPVTYGDSDKLNVGDMAVAIGNPLGELGGTVTAGIISAKDRELSIDGKTMKLLQTDSSINPGNSGGGLFNGKGQLIGLVVAKSSGSDVEGLGFAIPINTAADVAQQLMDNGYVKGQPWTGMTYTEGNSGMDSFFGGSSSSSVYIYSVDTSTAKLAGFKAGDMVFAVDNTEITSIDDLSSVITSHKVGDKLKFTVVRNGETKDLTIKLQEKTKSQSQTQSN